MPEVQQAPPKFLQMANSLRDEILRGQRKPGDELPSERDLATLWKVSRPTATRALQALRAQGLAVSRQGAGTFVRTHLDLSRRAVDRYAMSRSDGHVYPAGEWAEITTARLVKAPVEIARALELEPGSQAAKRHRVIHSDAGPVEASTSWFSPSVAAIAPRILERSRIREGTVSYVETVTGRRARTARDQLAARLATEQDARELGLTQPSAVLVVRHVVYDAMNHPLEVVDATYPPDRWTFEHDYPIGD
jgi:DNA-binding GntR family transcriptional regulator